MDEQEPDFGEYGAFLEDSVKHILKYKPAAIGFIGILPDGRTIGAYYQAGIAEKIQMAGVIMIDVDLDVIKKHAGAIREILDNARGDEASE